MNKKYLISIPLLNSESTAKNTLQFSVNTLLQPYYISEDSLLSFFTTEDDYIKYRPKAREIIFNASLRADTFMYNRLPEYSEEHILLLKRELALCLALNNFATFFHKEFAESVHRSKSFAEFSVATTVKNSPEALKEIIGNSKQCIEEAKQSIIDLQTMRDSVGMLFDKGHLNFTNKFSYRAWINNNLPVRSQEILANDKIWFNGSLYKDRVSNEGIIDVSDTRINYNR